MRNRISVIILVFVVTMTQQWNSKEAGARACAKTCTFISFMVNRGSLVFWFRMATYYTKVMERVQSKGDAFVINEIERLKRLIGKILFLLWLR